MNYVVDLVQWQNTRIGQTGDASDHFHAVINQSDILVMSIGDSWTWGGSLDSDCRLSQVYGALIAQEYNADWINIGCSGYSNSYILEHLDFVIHLLNQSSYKKIYLVITLTENGRDVKTPANFPYDYVSLFDRLCGKKETYDCIMAAAESFWIQQIKNSLEKMDSRYCMVIGQNFVWHQNLVDQLSQLTTVLDMNWIECMADAQKLPRPIRTNLVTGWVWDNISSVHDILKSDSSEFKEWCLPKIELSNRVNKWLDSSPMNYKKASKHPNAEGHRLWADYILQRLAND